MSRGFQALFVACILVASTTMFALAESRKLDRAPIKALVLTAGPVVPGHPRPAVFSPTCGCATRYARIDFRLGKPGPLEAWIVSPGGSVVKQLAQFEDVRRVSLRWDGTNTKGARVPDASYRLRLKVAGSTRTLPVFVVVNTASPHVAASVSPRKLTLNGDGVDDHALVTWHSPVQLFGIRVVATSGGSTETIKLRMHSKAGSQPWPKIICAKGSRCHQVRPANGRWSLRLVAADQAGNVSTVPLGSVEVASR